MIAMDTNVLVRLLIDDNGSPEQTNLAKSLLRNARQIYVPQIVQVEVVWVLESAYNFDKNTIILTLNFLKNNDIFVLQHPDQFSVALKCFEQQSADFSDYLIFSDCLENEYQLFTFDKKLARLEGVHLLKN